MKRFLITGAEGLIGSHLIPKFAGHAELFATSRKGIAAPGEGVSHLALDLSRHIDRNILPNKLDGIAYLAQSSRFRDFPAGVADMAMVNIHNMLTLLDHAVSIGAKTFVYASTGGIYGTGPKPFAEEACPAAHLGFYPASKLAGEILARAYESRIAVVILRFFFVYGAGQKREMLIPRLVDSVRSGKPISLQGKSGITINPIHADDAAAAVIAALQLTQGSIINIGGPEALTLRQICTQIGTQVKLAPRFSTTLDTKPGNLIGDISRQRQILGAPQIRFVEGVIDAL